ncbi:MAG: ABC transporter substrate-binding protein, partial [Acetatifactor sp.]|nr:ABC transporter substrate-binding protein [Acetatifactor sp.]
MNKTVKKLLILIGAVAVFAVLCILLNLRGVETFEDKYAGHDLTTDAEGAVREGTYTRYVNAHADAARPQTEVALDLFDYNSEGGVEVYNNYEGAEKSLFTDTKSLVTWEVEVPEAGFYNVKLDYLAPESRGVAAERAIYINGELPFDDAANMEFTRIWTNGGEVRVDNQGNEIRPTQVEVFEWQTAYCEDSMGYITEPYMFYLEKGTNTIGLEAVNEPLVLRNISILPVTETDTYEEYIAKQTGSAASGLGLSYIQVVQGEDSTVRSESSLYAKYDRSSPSTQPYTVMHTVLNYVGGDAWRSAGQWIQWDIEVPEDGFYNITIKGRQNYSRGSVSSRILYIDGEIPFEEAKNISFDYKNDWECKTLGDEDGEPYEFYLTAGTHTLRLEATLGEMGPIMEELEDCTFRLNQIYRTILVFTGATPDQYRDYHIDVNYPEVMEAMDLERMRLYKVVDEVVAYSGQKADKIATAQTIAQQLERFLERPGKITTEFTPFKDNITALGTAILNMTESKLDIDYIVISGTQTEPEKDTSGFFAKVAHEIRSFAASFIVDYDAVGDVYEDGGDDVIKVWILTGRDQGTILKAMVDDT